MEKNKYSQLELFTKSEGAQELNVSKPGFLARIRNYERALLVVIVFIISSIVFYCLGIEKGKKMVSAVGSFDLAANDRASKPAVVVPEAPAVNAAPAPAVKNIPVQNAAVENIPKPVQALEAMGYYTVQVASYKNKQAAQKEVDFLKKNGYASLVISKGSYVVVCVGNFNNKEKAKLVMGKLKNKYQDCMLRRL